MSNEKLLIKTYSNLQTYDEEALKDEQFMVQDLIGVLKDMNRNDVKVFVIVNYNGTQQEKEENIKYLLESVGCKANTVVLSWAYASTKEFPEDKYYDPNSVIAPKGNPDGLPVPIDKIVERESKLLESIGFIDFNFYTGYEYAKAYIYGNILGQEVVGYIKDNILKEYMRKE